MKVRRKKEREGEGEGEGHTLLKIIEVLIVG
jgi:hypothetical protein